MADTLIETSSCVSLSELRDKVLKTKSESSARNYLAMLGRLEEFCGSPVIEIGAVDAGFVAGFGDYLLSQGVTVSSALHFKKMLRAVLKESFGAGRKAAFKVAFAGVGGAVNAAPSFSLDDLDRIEKSSLAGSSKLCKVRDIFMYAVFGGGLTLAEVQAGSRADGLRVVTSRQQAIADGFKEQHGSELNTTARRLDEKEYERTLDAIGREAGLRHRLVAESAAECWIAAARSQGIPTASIAAVVPASSFAAVASSGAGADPCIISDTITSVADNFGNDTSHWYCMRCYSIEKDEAVKVAGLEDGDTFSACDDSSVGILAPFLFFRCHARQAVEIRRKLIGKAFVYTFSGTSTPAFIADSEMLTFMLLADVANDTLDYHFPGHGSDIPQPGTPARINVGQLSGYVGIVGRPSKDRCRVEITITSLSGLRLTADVPTEFITPIND